MTHAILVTSFIDYIWYLRLFLVVKKAEDRNSVD